MSESLLSLLLDTRKAKRQGVRHELEHVAEEPPEQTPGGKYCTVIPLKQP